MTEKNISDLIKFAFIGFVILCVTQCDISVKIEDKTVKNGVSDE